MAPFILIGSILVYAAVSWNDLIRRLIPNFLPIAVLALAILRLSVLPPPGTLLSTIGIAALVFLGGLFMFARGWFGGGDVKLISATILLIGAQDSLAFLLVMALAGGVLSVLVLIWAFVLRRLARRQPATDGSADLGDAVGEPMTVPYGVAISGAALFVVFQQLHLG